MRHLVLSELLQLQHALRAIADRPTPIAYAVARNLQRIEAITKAVDKVREDLIERFAERDDTGQRIMYVADPETQREVGPYEPGMKLAPGHQVMVKIAEEHGEGFALAMRELNSEAHAFEPYTIDADKIEGMTIEPWIVQTLLDVIIIDN